MTSLWTLDSSLVLAPEYIIRAKEDRSIDARAAIRNQGPRAYCKVRAEVSRSKMRHDENYPNFAQTPKRGTSGLSGDFARVSVQRKPPQAQRKHLLSVTHNVVLVEEVGGPGDDTDLEVGY